MRFEHRLARRQATARSITATFLAVTLICLLPCGSANAREIRVFSGWLSAGTVEHDDNLSLVIRYRARTRDAVRVGLSDVTLIHLSARKTTRLNDRIEPPTDRVDDEGYWVTRLVYHGLAFGDDNVRIEGRITLYLIGSQRSRRFSIDLKDEPPRRPPGSSIDWGLDRY